MPNDEDADYWVELQKSLADALRDYHHTNPEFIELMKSNPGTRRFTLSFATSRETSI